MSLCCICRTQAAQSCAWRLVWVIHKLTRVTRGGRGQHMEEQVSVHLAWVLRSSAAFDLLLRSTLFPSTSEGSRRDGFHLGSQDGHVIYRIICLDTNNLGLGWQRVGDQLPRLLCSCTFAAWERPSWIPGGFPGLDPSLPVPHIPGHPWTRLGTILGCPLCAGCP